MEEANKKDDLKWFAKNKSTFIFTISVIVVTVLFLITGYSTCVKKYFELSSTNFGQLGDYFNGIAAPVLSLITIILLYNSFLVQKEELKATREALEQSAKEMQNSSAIMARSEQNAKLERLESIVFKLIDKYENSRDDFNIKSSTAKKGIEVIYNIYKDVMSGYFLPDTGLNREEELLKEIPTLNNNDVKLNKINQLLGVCFGKIKNNYSYDEEYYIKLRPLVYKFIAIYKCVLHSEIPAEHLDYLKFAINNSLTREEMFFVKLFINQLDDLSNLRTELEPFGIVSTSESIYIQYLQEEIK